VNITVRVLGPRPSLFKDVLAANEGICSDAQTNCRPDGGQMVLKTVEDIMREI